MKVLFKNHDEGDRFKDETMRERFRKAVLFYERELLSLYPNVTKEELDSTIISCMLCVAMTASLLLGLRYG